MEPKQQIAIMRELTIQTFTIDLLQCQKRIKLCNAMKLICGVVYTEMYHFKELS